MQEFQQFTGAGGIWGLATTLKNVIRMSDLLGIEAKELAEQYNKMNSDFGLDLEQIGNAFRDIYTAANMSSIGTSKFNAMITQATGNLALFNVDFNEAAALASEFIETLGEEKASEFLSKFGNHYGAQGYQERFKSKILTGGASERAISSSLKAKSAQLMEGGGGGIIRNVLSEMGFDSGDLAGGIRKMTAEQQRQLLTQSKNQGLGDEYARQLQQATIMGQSLNQGGLDVTKAFGSLDKGAPLAMV